MEHSHHKTISAEVRDRLHQEATQALLDYRIADGISLAQALQYHCGNRGLGMQLEAAGTDYASMLNFIRQGGTDPNRHNIQKRIANQVLETLDAIHRQIRLDTATDDYAKAHEADHGIDLARPETPQTEEERYARQTHLFNKLWTSGRLPPKDTALVYDLIQQQEAKERRFYVAGLLMALWEYFDAQKMQLLLMCMEDDENEVRAQATLGYVLVHLRYRRRMTLCTDIPEPTETDWLREDLLAVQHFLFMQKNCLRIYEQMEEVVKQRLLKKEEQEEESEEEEEERNAFMHNVMQDQADLNPKTFTIAYNKPFFREMAAWWMPYDKARPETRHILGKSKNRSAAKLHDFLTGHCCDVDMHAIIQLLDMKGFGLKTSMLANPDEEIDHEAAVPEEPSVRTLFSHMIQDLYRFFHYSKWNKAYPNPFEMDIYMPGDGTLGKYFDIKGLQQLHAMLMRTRTYPYALVCAEDIRLLRGSDAGMLQKCGFCHQEMGNYPSAIQCYQQAELLVENDLWMLGQMVRCYMKMGYHREAIECLEQISVLPQSQPEDYLEDLAECHRKVGAYDKALQCFFELKYHNPDSIAAWRGIVRCALQLKQYGKAQAHARQIIGESGEATPEDHVMAGHVEWAAGDWRQALAHYRSAIALHATLKTEDSNANWEFILRDREILEPHGITPSDMMLMSDMLSDTNAQ